ncbi:MAG TPA: TIGR01777 family oxidoreductase [Longimicrobiales bacterium]
MKVAITGSTGLIGSALVEALGGAGHTITRVARRRGVAGEGGVVTWQPGRREIDAAGLEGHDAVIHLAGEPVVGWWTARKKARIRESRVRGTRLLSETLARLTRPPRVLVSASATGFYGNRSPEEPLDESSAPGAGFLAGVALEWERATAAAEAAGIRVVHARFGLVLSPKGGALAAMLPVFRLGLGGRLGSGRQVWSWITLEDVVAAVAHVLAAEQVAGPVNFVSPNPVTNAEFTRVLGRVLGRPAFFAVPAPAARLLLGEMADEMLLAGARVVPRKLLDSGYRFLHPELEAALRSILRRGA